MKKIVLLLSVFLMQNTLFAQAEINNFILEYNKIIQAKVDFYETPLHINQVSTPESIDFSKPVGLIQSFYSADNAKWAISDYLQKPANLVRDQEHFEAVKKRNRLNNYAQIESTYTFEYNNRQFCYVKYSIIMEQVPFPIMSIMVIEKSKGRWYISQLLNQNQVHTVLTNLDGNVLLDLLQHTNSIPFTEKNKTFLSDSLFSFTKMEQLYQNLENSKNNIVLSKIRDKRLIGEGNKGIKAELTSKSKSIATQTAHPFVLDSTYFMEYSKTDSVLFDQPENLEKWQNMPEAYLKNDAKYIRLNNRFSFFDGLKKYHILTYFAPEKKSMILTEKNGILSKESIAYQDFVSFFFKLKKDVFIDLLQENTKNKTLAEIKKECSSIDNVLNISLLIDYLENYPKEKQLILD